MLNYQGRNEETTPYLRYITLLMKLTHGEENTILLKSKTPVMMGGRSNPGKEKDREKDR